METINLSLHRSEDEPFVQKWEVARKCVFSVRLNLKVAEGVNPQDILDQLETTTQYMADYYRSK